MIKFTVRPQYNAFAKWQPTNMKVDNLRVWVCRDGNANLHKVGYTGNRYFYSWSQDREPNYIN